jgi:Tfp pilus assembly protein PilV
MHPIPSRRQGGFTLVEVLVAFLMMTLGLLAVIRLQPALRQHAELARQRSEATRLAQQDVERLRGFVQINMAGSAPAYETIGSASYAIEPDALGSPRYAVERRVDAVAIPNARAVDVAVRWIDRAGEPQQVMLATLIAASDPALAAARLLPR